MYTYVYIYIYIHTCVYTQYTHVGAGVLVAEPREGVLPSNDNHNSNTQIVVTAIIILIIKE